MKYPEDFESIMAHEMIHLIHCNHSKKFYSYMEKIKRKGCKVLRYSREPALVKWEYVCKESNCDYVFKSFRKRKRKYICPTHRDLLEERKVD